MVTGYCGVALGKLGPAPSLRRNRTVSITIGTLLLAFAPDRIAFQDIGALLAQQPAVTERWQQHLIASRFGVIQAATFHLPQPLGTAIPQPPIYTLTNFDPGEITGSFGEHDLMAPPPQFPKANRQAKADLLISRPRQPMPPLPPLAVIVPDASPKKNETAPLLLTVNTPVLAPVAFVHFCIRYPEDCRVRKSNLEIPVRLTQARFDELSKINRDVNNAIRPRANFESALAEKWLVAPREGDCNDYAVTKRHELLARGWPSNSLLLAEVVLSSGEHHLVLTVRTNEGDLVLDNLDDSVRHASLLRYKWVRAQQTKNPRFWSKISPGLVDRVAMLAGK